MSVDCYSLCQLFTNDNMVLRVLGPLFVANPNPCCDLQNDSNCTQRYDYAHIAILPHIVSIQNVKTFQDVPYGQCNSCITNYVMKNVPKYSIFVILLRPQTHSNKNLCRCKTH